MDGSWATAPPAPVARAPSSGPALSQPLGSRERPLSSPPVPRPPLRTRELLGVGSSVAGIWKGSVLCVFWCNRRELSPTPAAAGRSYFFCRVKAPAPRVANVFTSSRGTKSGAEHTPAPSRFRGQLPAPLQHALGALSLRPGCSWTPLQVHSGVPPCFPPETRIRTFPKLY